MSVSRLKQDIHDYWQSLPTTTACKDLSSDGPLFRFNVHLHLTYHLIHIFIGRVFIFTSPRDNSPYSSTEQNTPESSNMQASFISSCIDSALEIVNLCQRLQDTCGLSRASYTEFTCCRAALLAILAQRIVERSSRLRKASNQGIKLLKYMSLGVYAADAEKRAIEAIERALQRLSGERQDQDIDEDIRPSHDAGSGYDQFRSWAMLWQKDSDNGMISSAADSRSGTKVVIGIPNTTTLDPSIENMSPLQDFNWDMYSPSLPFDIGEFTSIPSVDE